MSERSPWIIEKLEKRHDRQAFSCGVPELDKYLHQFAGQNERAGVTQHFVAVGASGDPRILGYYALSAGAVDFDVLPEALRRRLPRYPVPVAHLGRLAVDRSMQGHGLGEDLLMDAFVRIESAAREIGIHAVEVVAISEIARTFYLKYGFAPLLDNEFHLFLPMSAIRALMAR